MVVPMRKPGPLPRDLTTAPFTRRQALGAGLSDARLRSSDVRRVGHSIYLAHAEADERLVLAAMVCAATPGTWVSHTTAALLRGLWLPGHLQAQAQVHISRRRGLRAPRRPGVVGHQVAVADGEVGFVQGVPVSTPGRLWLELGALLAVDDLVALGDHLVRLPRAGFENRRTPYAEIRQLAEVLGRHPRNPGAPTARAALPLVRVGADSRPETALRLAIVRAGLPEPELQVRLDRGDPFSVTADLGYRRRRLAIQYDGACHLDRERQTRDNRRDAAFSVAGWTVIKANAEDLRHGFRRVIALVQDVQARQAPGGR